MLQLKIDITQDIDTGLNSRYDDITGNCTTANPGGYGMPNPEITDVKKTRFLFSSFLTEQNAQQDVTTCIASVEYEVYGSGSNTVVVDTKTFELGDKFILEADAIPVIGVGLKLRETGRFATQTNFLPVDYFVEFTPAEIGINQLTNQDSAYEVTYEVYTTEYEEGDSFPDGTYIVKGNALDIISIDGVLYNVGEVFTTTGGVFVNEEGTCTINAFEASVTETFVLFYNAWRDKVAVEQCFVINPCPCKEEISYKLFQIESRLEAIQYNYQDNLNNDASGTQGLLDEIIQIAANKCNCS